MDRSGREAESRSVSRSQASAQRCTLRVRNAEEGVVYHLMFDGNLSKLSGAQLRRHLQGISLIPAEEQRLTFRGQAVRNDSTGKSLGLTDKALLILEPVRSPHHNGPPPSNRNGEKGNRGNSAYSNGNDNGTAAHNDIHQHAEDIPQESRQLPPAPSVPQWRATSPPQNTQQRQQQQEHHLRSPSRDSADEVDMTINHRNQSHQQRREQQYQSQQPLINGRAGDDRDHEVAGNGKSTMSSVHNHNHEDANGRYGMSFYNPQNELMPIVPLHQRHNPRHRDRDSESVDDASTALSDSLARESDVNNGELVGPAPYYNPEREHQRRLHALQQLAAKDKKQLDRLKSKKDPLRNAEIAVLPDGELGDDPYASMPMTYQDLKEAKLAQKEYVWTMEQLRFETERIYREKEIQRMREALEFETEILEREKTLMERRVILEKRKLMELQDTIQEDMEIEAQLMGLAAIDVINADVAGIAAPPGTSQQRSQHGIASPPSLIDDSSLDYNQNHHQLQRQHQQPQSNSSGVYAPGYNNYYGS